MNAPLYKYGCLYFNDYYGISCKNATDGTEIWFTYLSRENLSPGLTYAYGRVYTVNELGILYVLDALTGEKLSYYQLGSQTHSAPSLYNGNLYIGCNDGNLYCFGEARLMGDNPPAPTVTIAPSPLSPSSPVPVQTPVSPLPSPAVAPSSGAESTTTYIAISAAVVVVVAGAAALVLRRRK